MFEIFRNRKKLWIRKKGWGEYHDNPSETFCRTESKKFVEESFSVSLISVIENFYAQQGNVMVFCRKFIFLTVPENFV